MNLLLTPFPAGDAYFVTATLKAPEAMIDEMEAKFTNGDFWMWTPPNLDVNHHFHILKKSNGAKIFAP